MALYRCHPESKFRFIYNWLHRIVGLLAFILSIPTIFMIAYWLPSYHEGLITILSIWTGWVVFIIVAFEFLQYRSRKLRKLVVKDHEIRLTNGVGSATHHEKNEGTVLDQEELENDTINRVKLILLGIHLVVAIGLAILLIVLIWIQQILNSK